MGSCRIGTGQFTKQRQETERILKALEVLLQFFAGVPERLLDHSRSSNVDST